MEEVIRAFKCSDPEQRIPVLRLELDYELALLHEAIMEKSMYRINKCKVKLKQIRHEMLMLEAL